MSSQRFRLKKAGRLDRNAPLKFRFDGKIYEGLRGDTLASALLANGVHLVGRSFKISSTTRTPGCRRGGKQMPLYKLEKGIVLNQTFGRLKWKYTTD